MFFEDSRRDDCVRLKCVPGIETAMGFAGTASAAWDEAEPHVYRLLLKVAFTVSMWVATPFFALAFGFWLFGKPLLWIGVAAALGALVLLAGLVAFLVVRHRLRRLRRRLRDVETVERFAFGP